MPGKWNDKWLSQDQLIAFCEKHYAWLSQGGRVTLFLIKKDEHKPITEAKPQDNAAVVRVVVKGGDLDVNVYRIRGDDFWHGVYCHRVVVPWILGALAL